MTPEPDNDLELERQRTDIETAFREGWLPLDVSKPRILTEHVYAEAHQFIDQRGGTWLDEAIIQAVRDGKQPADTLPPLRPDPYRGYITDARVIIIGSGPGQRVAVLFPPEDFPGAQFGHRFEPDPPAAHQDAQRLMDQIEAGAVHQRPRT